MRRSVVILIVFTLLLTSCSFGEKAKAEEALKNEIKADIEAQAEVDAKALNKTKLDDFDAIITFLKQDTIFLDSYYALSGSEFAYDHYKMHEVDFTADGVWDRIITVWTDEDEYLPALFITLEDGKYVYYKSDFRAAPEDTFQVEDGFVLKVAQDNYYDIAVILKKDEDREIKNTYTGFAVIDETYNEVYNPKMKYKNKSSIVKKAGYFNFDVHNRRYFYDEKGIEYIVEDRITNYKYNASSFEFENSEVVNVAYNQNEVMSDHILIGNHENLKTFDVVLEETHDYKETVKYYMENRTDFSRKTRSVYAQAALDYAASQKIDLLVNVKPSENKEITVYGENSIASEVKGVFAVVGKFYIESGETFIASYLEAPYYSVVCIDPEVTYFLRAMQFDMGLMTRNPDQYSGRLDENVDVIYSNREETLKAVEDIVYPVILIHSLEDLKTLENSTLWKTTVAFIPDNFLK